ncbi:MAG: hypothetical protein ABJ084_00935 [Halioglobus sp.]
MKKLAVAVLSITALILIGIAAYYCTSPKVVIENRSSVPVHEAIVYLPGSQLSFDPIKPGEKSTIYYSPQKQSGQLKYSMRVNGIPQTGALPYSGSPEYGRVIHIEVDELGAVTVSVAN